MYELNIFFCVVGVRYYLRGLDVEGHPANYVETEQIIQHDGECTSFVQVVLCFMSLRVFIIIMINDCTCNLIVPIESVESKCCLYSEFQLTSCRFEVQFPFTGLKDPHYNINQDHSSIRRIM